MAEFEPRGTVLLVESDVDERARLAACLEGAGFEVMVCPGPSGPDYTCVGVRTLECPLASGASVVVFDTELEGDGVMEGTAAHEILEVYLLGGHRVIALAPRLHEEGPGQLVRLPRHPDEDALASAVTSMADRGPVERL